MGEINKTEYLGDGVYVDDEGFQMRLYTKRGPGVHEVYLEYDSALPALIRWLERLHNVKFKITKLEKVNPDA